MFESGLSNKKKWAKRCEEIRLEHPLTELGSISGGSSIPSTERIFTHSLIPLLEYLNGAIMLLRRNGDIVAANGFACRLLGVPQSSVVGKSFNQFIGAQYVEEYRLLFSQMAQDSDLMLQHGPKDITLVRGGKETLNIDLSLSCLPLEADNPEAFVHVMLHDLSKHKQESERLLREARTDYLTGVANRHAFAEVLEEQWHVCHHDNMPMSMLFIDVDYFKQFNDAYGHVNGDKCLKKIADAIVFCMPSHSCTVARYGGEEFAVLMPRFDCKVAQLTALRIKQQIEELSFVHMGLNKDVGITASIGVGCQHMARFENVEALLQNTDKALYRAKAAGRNQIVTI
ncbi:diguanylate cyclase [Aestuariibacter sp. AA17]|uniref:diguanylate cyclase n=1 Tax=Fluctibacter corallii TaxID=2984329 RepID=A0ABT3A840_9ALTE|nr:diguanylate cyclase [Aestuariibacter sp. AA17]MCV2884847.1 diguanylate cyclase [Aestuariibacter sp. AA17]